MTRWALSMPTGCRGGAGAGAVLRPLYQGTRFARGTVAGPAQVGDLLQDAQPIEGALKWPKEPRARILAVKGLLADGALTADGLAGHFKGRGVAREVARLLDALVRLGQVRRAPDGTFRLLRAA